MPYEGPRDAIVAVLAKLGIDPRDRIDDSDQDPEYTACRSDEIDRYFALYQEKGIGAHERAVLCCFLLEGLNELVQIERSHPRQEDILTAIFASEVHSGELAYWMDTSDPDPENWWPITTTLLEHARREVHRP
jgi:hypothetical protein